MTLKKVEFIHRDDDGVLHRITVSSDDFYLILKHAKDPNDLYEFLNRFGKWGEIKENES